MATVSGFSDEPADHGSATRQRKKEATQELILDTAERLFAENGIYAVSNRQIAEAAGQGNTAVVGYHFGSRTDLIRALVRRFHQGIEPTREAMLEQISGSTQIRDWIDCQVRPITMRFDELGSPTWFARFGAQLISDPELRDVMLEESWSDSPSLQQTVDGVSKCLPFLPAQVQPERTECALHLIINMCAQRERALADGLPLIRNTWSEMATGLVDIIVGIWTAPVTPA
ncbi:TetR family transcriptional regulator [Gordonia sp. HNM0687]|uniref:TetR family transcriptional regulator n=1 Tax=Gordonia mangrovi TaxID=2665643 RepID=A0A6L7GTG1_9ACTN|nr:TetR/AcrR family transcriptional regulator [Gordonia mangrovi]MXP23314.1 TetR family transcriptional regulator [Gordonia mangrovi]UVF76771.1 TetR/AcrR family transcriptional regulator [Gordonia mangrovi]